MENWETGGNRLKINHFEFPSQGGSLMVAETAFSQGNCGRTCVPNLETGVSVPPPRREPVTRRHRPEPAALDELVELLYRLLMDDPWNESAPAGSTCFPGPHK